MLATVVYAIWQERNSRNFKARSRNECVVTNEITVRATISALRGFKPSQENIWLQRSWGISQDILNPAKNIFLLFL